MFNNKNQKKYSIYANLPIRLKLAPHCFPGGLLTFSGLDGSGKTTAIGMAQEYLHSRNIDTETVKMPSQECRQLDSFRKYVNDPATSLRGEVDLASLCLICLGDRLMSLRTHIIPLLKKGTWVLCDRYVYTPMAELLVVGCKREDMEAVISAANLFPAPDLPVLTNVSINEALIRIRKRPEERDKKIDKEFYECLLEAFLQVGEANGLVLLSTETNQLKTFEDIKILINSLISSKANKRFKE